MAEKKTTEAPKKIKHTIKPAATNGSTAQVNVKPAAAVEGKEGAGKYRLGAVLLWVAAIAFEVIAILLLFGKLNWTFLPTLTIIIIALVLDLICIIIGSQLWKKANRLDPASEKNKVKFWLWNNMGLIVCAFAFIPFVILALTNKNADKKTKTIAAIVAAIALLIGGLCSYEWNPISAEEKADAIEEYSNSMVYWTNFGKVYHLSTECGHLNHSDELTEGNVEQAIEAGAIRVCKDCEKKYAPQPADGEKDLDNDEDIDEGEEIDKDEDGTLAAAG